MERKEKVVEREEEQEQGDEEMVKKLRRGFLAGGGMKRAGPSTPSPIWRLEFLSPSTTPSPPPQSSAAVNQENIKKNSVQEFLTNTKAVSARKFCANLWEIEPFPLPTVRRGLAKLRRDHQKKDKVHHTGDVEPPDQPPSTGSLRRQISVSLVPHHRLVEKNRCSKQPVTPASCSSSMEVAPYKPAITPTSSLDFKSGRGEPSYSLKTSTELHKVLNRIWNLEEQHASNMSLMKALKMELDDCRTEIKEFQREKQTEKEASEGIMNRAEENKTARKIMEQERLKAAVESVRDELEDERKLRRKSESLHRKLARELSEVKSSFSKALKELERERKARVLLENLADEFARAIREYEQEIRVLRSKFTMERGNHERLILHISEAWLDERLQMKLAEDKDDLAEKNSAVDKLGLDIETFLKAKRSLGSRKSGQYTSNEKKKSHFHRHSLESYTLNGVGEEHCSDSGDSHSLKLNGSASRRHRKGSSKEREVADEFANSNPLKQRVRSRKPEKVRSLSNLQEQDDDHVARSSTRFQGKEHDFIRRDNQLVDDLYGTKTKWIGDETRGSKSDQVLDQLNRNQSLSSEGDKIHPESDVSEEDHHIHGESIFPGHASPVQDRNEKLAPSDLEKSESVSKLPRNAKENTLQAKLMEARLESRHSRSRSSRASV